MFPEHLVAAALAALVPSVTAAAQHAAPGTLFEQNLGVHGPDAHFVARHGGVGVGRTPTVVNHLRGDPPTWTTGAATYARVAWRDVWPGVDVELYEGTGGLEYDLRREPGADLSDVAFRWKGQRSLVVDVDGALVLDTPLGEITQSAPVVFQADGTPVDGRFELRGDGLVGFAVGAHDTSQPLIVDPIIAFAGYAPAEDVVAVAVAPGPSPDVYLIGDTTLTNVLTTPGVYQPDKAGFRDTWLAKLDHSGNVVRRATYLGGGDESDDFAVDVEVAPDGSLTAAVDVEGTGFPTTPGAHDGSTAGRTGAIAKLSSDGTTLVWSTYVITAGFAGADLRDVHVAADGEVLFTGQGCGCSDLALAPGADVDAATWVTAVNASGTADWTSAEVVATDSQDRLVLFGRTRLDLPTTANASQPSRPGAEDFFVAVVSEDATTVDDLSYLGTPGSAAGAAARWPSPPTTASGPDGSRRTPARRSRSTRGG